MIPTGTLREAPESNPGRSAEIIKAFKRDLGREGLTSAMREDEVVGYPSNVDADGNHVATVEPADAPARELKPGEIGYSNSERFKTGPQIITRRKDN